MGRGMNTTTRELLISKVDVESLEEVKKVDVVACEVPLHIFVGNDHFVSILCSPTMLRELVVGHLLGEGVVNSVDEGVNIEFREKNRCFVTVDDVSDERVVALKPYARLIVSACGASGYGSLSDLLKDVELKPLPFWQVQAKIIVEGVRRLNTLGEVFRKTGGVHVAVLFKRDGEIVMVAEDVGRHNAVDKVIGAAALKREGLNECFLALSGRLTGDIVLKAVRVGVPIVASLSAAVDSGVEVAEKAGLTLVGFVRGNRMNIYTGSERIKL